MISRPRDLDVANPSVVTRVSRASAALRVASFAFAGSVDGKPYPMTRSFGDGTRLIAEGRMPFLEYDAEPVLKRVIGRTLHQVSRVETSMSTTPLSATPPVSSAGTSVTCPYDTSVQ